MTSCPSPDSTTQPPSSSASSRDSHVAAADEQLLAELVHLRAQLTATQAQLATSEARVTRLADVILLQAQALAARAASPSLDGVVPLPVPHVPRDMSTPVPPVPRDMKGGRGVAAATTKSELSTSKSELSTSKSELSTSKAAEKKRRQRARRREEKLVAAGHARAMSPGDTSTLSPVPVPRGHVPPLPPTDTSPSAAAPVAPVASRPKWMEDSPPSPDKTLFAWFLGERRQRFPSAVDYQRPPARWREWHTTALAACGGDEEKLRATCLRFLDDPWAQGLERPCPPEVLISDRVWPKHVPGQHEGAVIASPRRGAHSVGGGDMPEPQPLPDTPAGRVWGKVLEAARAVDSYNGAYLASMTVPVDCDDGVLSVRCMDRFNFDFVEEYWSRWLDENAGRFGLRAFLFVAPDEDQVREASSP